MKFVVQRVEKASVNVDNSTIGQIDQGLLVLVGIHSNDTKETADKMLHKLLHLRIFEDENGKTNLDISSINGKLLMVSQFTLYADCRKGNRPSFTHAGSPELAEELYQYMIAKCHEMRPNVQQGEFGAHMKISLINDGPFTIILDSEDICGEI